MQAGTSAWARSRATDIGRGPQCCGSSPFSISGWRIVSQQKSCASRPSGSLSTSSDGGGCREYLFHRPPVFLVTPECIGPHTGAVPSHSAVVSSTVAKSRPASVLFRQTLHRHLQSNNIFPAHSSSTQISICSGSTGQLLPHPSALFYLSDLVRRLRHWNRRQLNVELFPAVLLHCTGCPKIRTVV